MAITKITQPCEPCEPSSEPFSYNGSHANQLKLLSNITHVNDVNHLHMRVRVSNFLFLVFKTILNTKNKLSLTREKTKKSFTSFTFIKNVYKPLIFKLNICEPFLINHSPMIHIIHMV